MLLGYTMILLVLYVYHPTWFVFLSIASPGWKHWVGFGLGLASLEVWTWTHLSD